MKSSGFRTSASSSLKRNIVRIKRQNFGNSALFRILRGGTSMKSKGGTLWRQKIRKKRHTVPKKIEQVTLLPMHFFIQKGFRKCLQMGVSGR